MPLYDFTCIQCGHSFEEITNFESTFLACPECSSTNTQRDLSAANIKRNTMLVNSKCMSSLSSKNTGCGREGCGSGNFPCGIS